MTPEQEPWGLRVTGAARRRWELNARVDAAAPGPSAAHRGYRMQRIRARVIWQVVADVLVINLASILALALRYMPQPTPAADRHFYAEYALWLTLFRILIFWRLNLYKVFWRYVGTRDLLAVAQGVT